MTVEVKSTTICDFCGRRESFPSKWASLRLELIGPDRELIVSSERDFCPSCLSKIETMTEDFLRKTETVKEE